jgi:type 1 fimbria pilin
MKTRATVVLIVLVATLALAAGNSGKSVTVKGYVIDSACAYKKDLSKPISVDCAKQCAKAGSPLVILADDGTVYWPIDAATPAKGQNEKLMGVAGHKVTATGTVYDRGGSKAMVIDSIAAAK